jgi:2-polyprenyl-6-methoxyphenol hydroxylase-like FAD-dependent oxidoreductase
MGVLPSAEHAVVIAGGGPTGMMLAGELTLAGVDVVIVERRASQEVEGSRAGGLYARTIEVLDQRGVADRFLAEGRAAQVQGFAAIPLDISDFPTRYNYGLALWQRDTERRVPNVEAALQMAESLGGRRQMGPEGTPGTLVVGQFTDPKATSSASPDPNNLYDTLVEAL